MMSWAEENGLDIGDWDDFDHATEHFWKTKKGTIIKISEMSDQHLFNAYKKFKHKHESKPLKDEIILRLFKKHLDEMK